MAGLVEAIIEEIEEAVLHTDNNHVNSLSLACAMLEITADHLATYPPVNIYPRNSRSCEYSFAARIGFDAAIQEASRYIKGIAKKGKYGISSGGA